MAELNNFEEEEAGTEVGKEPEVPITGSEPENKIHAVRKGSDIGLNHQKMEENRLQDIQAYLDRMAYDQSETPYKYSPQISRLATPHPTALKQTYTKFKNVLIPKRAARLKRQVDELYPISTEEYEKMVQAREKAKANRSRVRQIRAKAVTETLEKLKSQLSQKAMSDIIDKFVAGVAGKAVAISLNNESTKCGIVKNSAIINQLLYIIHEKINGEGVAFSGVVPVSHVKIAIVLAQLIDHVKCGLQKTVLDEPELDDLNGSWTTKAIANNGAELKRRARLAASKKELREQRS